VRGFLPRLLSVGTVTSRVAARPREFVRVAGPDAEDFLQRMLSNDVSSAPCGALLLTPKARVIAPVVVVRREPDDFLLLTEPGLGEAVRSTLLRARFAAKVEIEPEEHRSVVVLGSNGDGIPNADYGEPAAELLDTDLEPTLAADELERLRIEAGRPIWGKEIDHSILPAEAGLDETHVSFTKGCYPGQEPIARLRHRGKVNRRLRVLEVESAEPGDELLYGGKAVGRVTSSIEGRALAFVRVEVPEDATLEVGSASKTARVVGP
jgi:folate-binding protein YgfZ